MADGSTNFIRLMEYDFGNDFDNYNNIYVHIILLCIGILIIKRLRLYKSRHDSSAIRNNDEMAILTKHQHKYRYLIMRTKYMHFTIHSAETPDYTHYYCCST